jgi:hypothetical protein
VKLFDRFRSDLPALLVLAVVFGGGVAVAMLAIWLLVTVFPVLIDGPLKLIIGVAWTFASATIFGAFNAVATRLPLSSTEARDVTNATFQRFFGKRSGD